MVNWSPPSWRSSLASAPPTSRCAIPNPSAFEDDNESKAPCGDFTPDFGSGKVVDFHVDGEALAMRMSQQQCNWLFRATADQKAASCWQQLSPVVSQTGLGDYCQPRVTAPSDFAGKKGVVSIVSSAADGLLYQVGGPGT